MTYLDALSHAYREGMPTSGISFSPELWAMLTDSRATMMERGVRLWIEADGSVHESVRDIGNGKRVFKYTGSFLHAFEREGMFYPDPSLPPFRTRGEAVEGGDFFFLVDAGGAVIGMEDTLTGNHYGERIPTQRVSVARGWLVGVILLAVFTYLLIRLLT